jgi:hypothetical protein
MTIPAIDVERDTAEHDLAAKLLAETPERVLWILYLAAFNSGFRVDRAPHEIARLTPRKPGHE